MCVIFLIGFVADWTVDGRHCPLWYTNCTQTVQGNFSLSLCNGYCSSQFCYIGSEDIVYWFVLGVKRVSSTSNVARRPLGRIFSDKTKDQTCFCFNEVLKCNKGKQGRTLTREHYLQDAYILFPQYVISVHPESEDGHFYLGKYYDRLMTVLASDRPTKSAWVVTIM